MRLIIFILIIAAWTTALKAAPSINTNYKHYSISTTSADQLLSDLNSASPVRENGEIYYGYTKTYITWNFWWQTDDGICRINRVSVNLDINYTLPEPARKFTDTRLQKVWGKWYPALVKHENNHASHAIDIANKIEHSIKNLPPRSSCSDLEATANNTGNILIKKLNKLDKKYDEVTDHGKTEGTDLSKYL